jgi:hypothetical protein
VAGQNCDDALASPDRSISHQFAHTSDTCRASWFAADATAVDDRFRLQDFCVRYVENDAVILPDWL